MNARPRGGPLNTVRRIELLVSAVDAGSFARAARLLNLDPSAVSHAVKQLEKVLSVPLFYRTTRQLTLTEDGREVYRRGIELLKQIAELESTASVGQAAIKGTLRVGMSVTMGRAI